MNQTNFHDRVIDCCATIILESLERHPGQTFFQLREYGKFLHQRTFEEAVERLLERHQIRKIDDKYYLF